MVFKEILEETPIAYSFQVVSRGKNDSNIIEKRLLKYLAILSKLNGSDFQAVIDVYQMDIELGASSIQDENLPLYDWESSIV